MFRPTYRFWRQLWQRASSPAVQQGVVEQQLEAARERLPTPVLWLLGKTQSGKSSVIRALTGNDKAEIGSGFRACTRTSREYAFPSEDECLARFLDTPGLGEIGYDATEDIEKFREQADVLVVVLKALDHAQQGLLEVVEQIVRAEPHWPLLVVQSTLHEGYPTPQTGHIVPYPYADKPYPETVPETLARSLEAQQAWFERGVFTRRDIRFVPVDFTLPQDEFDPQFYGLDHFWTVLQEVLPAGVRGTLRTMPELRRLLQDEFLRTAHRHVLVYALAAAGAGAVPLPVVDIPMVLALQAKMFHTVASIYHQPMSVSRMAELTSTLGMGFAARLGIRSLAKMIPIPGVGSGISAVFAGASTYALGEALCRYFSLVHEGDVPSKDVLRKFYAEEFERGKNWIAGQMGGGQAK